MRLICSFMILGGVFLTAACGPKASEPQPEQKKASVSAAAPAPPANSEGADVESGEEAEGWGRPTTEQEMYGYQGEVMPYPPPMGMNGETAWLEAASTTAIGFTGNVVFSGIPKENEPTQWLHMQGENGLAYDLQIVDGGGVDAIGKLDWSKIMMEPIGMEDYLKEKTEQSGTLVFVYRVMRAVIPAQVTNGGLCRKIGYLAITTNSPSKNTRVAAFGPGSWPPKDSSTLCGSYTYAPLEQEAGSLKAKP